MADPGLAEGGASDAQTLCVLSKSQTCKLANQKIGGKARGLVRLMQLGLNVPPAFVVTRASACELPDFERRCAELATDRFAIRSSMEEEDGGTHSFAGQFKTFLHIEGIDAARKAIADCFASAQSVRSAEYGHRRAGGDQTFAQDMHAAVIVQRMVRARKAGVLFTADPVTQFRDRIVIEAVPGFADRLVGGLQNAAVVLQVSRAGKILQIGGASAESCLTSGEIEALVAQALRAEAAQGAALDLEWAIDEDGVLHWLQMRPITTLDCDPREFDTPEILPTALLTRGNVGEILPGALTPLTLSTSVAAIEAAMQRSLARASLPVSSSPSHCVFKLRLGHLFIDLSEMVRLATVLIGAREENFVVPFCGCTPSEIPRLSRVSWWRRIVASVRFFADLLAAPWRIRAFERRVESAATWAIASSAQEEWHAVERILGVFREACDLHLVVSLGSGAMHGVLVQLLAWWGVPREAREREIAELLQNVEGVDEVPSALDAIFKAICAQAHVSEKFFAADFRDAQDWLCSGAAGYASILFEDFIQRYGHRGLNEFEMSAPSWRMDPSPLIAALQARSPAPVARAMHTTQNSPRKAQHARHFLLSALLVLRFARAAVRNRERTKSLSVRVAERLKFAYRNLGEFLVDAGVLVRAEDCAFLTHDEIGELVATRACTSDARVRPRQRALAIQRTLEFPNFSLGKPEALTQDPLSLPARGEAIRGQAVSRGCVTGPARVVQNLDALQQEQNALTPFRPDEILITQAIDIAWTPYFACVAGLATELGSAVSHGAVLAREYGLPAVVNLRNATRSFQTGDWVTLDADHGILRRALPEEQRVCEALRKDSK